MIELLIFIRVEFKHAKWNLEEVLNRVSNEFLELETTFKLNCKSNQLVHRKIK